jgi:hypothetical protein
MTLANTSLVQLRRIKETVFGTTPVAGNSNNLRVTGHSFNFDVKKEMSKELRSDRQVAGAVPVSAGATGGFKFHLSYGEFDPEIESCLQGTWGVFGVNGVGASFTGAFTATTIVPTPASAGASAFSTLQRGQWFRVASAGANNGKYFKVSSTVTPTDSLITLDALTPAVVSATETGTSIQTSRIANGATQTSYTYEAESPDVTQFFSYKGMTPGKMTLDFAAAALTDGSFEFMGKNSVRAAVTAMPGTANASRAFDIQSGATGVSQLWEGGALLSSTFIKSLNLSIDNVQRSQEAIANYGYVGIGSGTGVVKATMSAYFADGVIYDKFLNNTYTSIVVGSQDAAGNGYIITMPRVNLMSAKVVAGSKDADLMADFELQAFSDDANSIPGLRKTIFIDRVGVALAPLV